MKNRNKPPLKNGVKHLENIGKPAKTGSEAYKENSDMNLCACSSQDCTGLIPRAASGGELEAYEELYPYLPATSDDSKTDDSF